MVREITSHRILLSGIRILGKTVGSRKNIPRYDPDCCLTPSLLYWAVPQFVFCKHEVLMEEKGKKKLFRTSFSQVLPFIHA